MISKRLVMFLLCCLYYGGGRNNVVSSYSESKFWELDFVSSGCIVEGMAVFLLIVCSQ